MDGWPDEELFCVGDATVGIERCRKDNCPRTPNTGQEDFDGNGQGDACQGDIDGDGVYNRHDNCPYIPNGSQVIGRTFKMLLMDLKIKGKVKKTF